MSKNDPRSSSRRGLSRRGFLKGAGLGMAAAGMTPVIGKESLAAEQEQKGGKLLKLEGAELKLEINGKPQRHKARSSTTLLDFLRDDLDMTGTKKVCNRGACGACTVMVDGESVNSCCMLAHDAAGKKVTTVEGICQQDGSPNDLQRAFISCDALQCGYCTPGMVISATALLAEEAKPSRDRIREGMSGNICRCGTYQNIFEAIELVSGPKGGDRK